MPNGKPTLCFIGFGEAGQAIAAGLRDAGASTDCRHGTSCFRSRGGELRLPPDPKRGALRQFGRGCGARCRHDRFGGHRGIERGAAIRLKRILPASRFSSTSILFHRARKQETANFWPRCQPLCRRRGAGADLSGAAPDADAARGAPCRAIAPRLPRSACAPAGRPRTGAAAAIKMVRSVMIKGIEALTLECFLAAAAGRCG